MITFSIPSSNKKHFLVPLLIEDQAFHITLCIRRIDFSFCYTIKQLCYTTVNQQISIA